MTPLTRLVSLATLPIALLISMAYLLGAEDGPGDGFTAGIISALALTLEYLAFGYREARNRIRWIRFEQVLLAGISVVLAAAVLPLLAGGSVLGILEFTLEIPYVGEVHLSRSLLFEVGVYLVVVGGSLTAIDALREHGE